VAFVKNEKPIKYVGEKKNKRGENDPCICASEEGGIARRECGRDGKKKNSIKNK